MWKWWNVVAEDYSRKWAGVGIYVGRGSLYNLSSDELGEVGPTTIFSHEAKNLHGLGGVDVVEYFRLRNSKLSQKPSRL